jgi:hypothetical protein
MTVAWVYLDEKAFANGYPERSRWSFEAKPELLRRRSMSLKCGKSLILRHYIVP